MNFASILAALVQAIFTRSAAFAVTVGGQHLSVTITEASAPGNSGSFWNVFLVLAQIQAGKTGTFTIGNFTVTIQELQAA